MTVISTNAASWFLLLQQLTIIVIGLASFSNGQKIPFKVVLVGDSIAAGSGNRNEFGVADYVPPLGCNRSPSSWGYQYADSLRDEFEVTVVNRACTDAEIPSFAETPHQFRFYVYGDFSRIRCPLRDSFVGPTRTPEVFFEQISTLECGRFLELQIEGVDPTVDLVLATFGGNDAQFGESTGSCFLPLLQDASDCKESLEVAEQLIDNSTIADALRGMLRAARDKMTASGETVPYGKFVLVDYPYVPMDSDFELTNDEVTIQPALETRRIQLKAMALYQAVVDEINEETGIDFAYFFNKTKEVFEGHEVDPSIRRNPDGWMHEEEIPRVWDSFHPNRIGNANLAAALIEEGRFGAMGGAALRTITKTTTKQSAFDPVAWLGDAYAGVVGVPIQFTAEGSYDPLMVGIESYQWDVDGDERTFEYTTSEPTVSHVYTKPYNGFIYVKVSTSSGSSMARAFVSVESKR